MSQLDLTSGLVGIFVLVGMETACLAADPCDEAKAAIAHHLEIAESNRDWVEFWSDLDQREARAELRYFAQHIALASKALAEGPCDAAENDGLLRDRLRHEANWLERQRKRLAPGASVALGAPVHR